MTRRDETYILRPPAGEYLADMRLQGRDDGSVLAAWVERGGQPECVAWRACGSSTRSLEGKAEAQWGAPGKLQLCGDGLFWTEWRNGQGVLFGCELNVDHCMAQRPGVLDGVNCGEVAAATSADGKTWLLVEAWRESTVDLLILQFTDGDWHLVGSVSSGGFAVRPRLTARGDGLMATWDAHDGCAYRIQVAVIDGDGIVASIESLPCPQGNRETLSSTLSCGDGTRLIARCRERLVESSTGACGYHSELVVAEYRDAQWDDVMHVDIDWAMNPWMAAYWGFRRFPTLLSLKGEPWLLWEEKEDIESMDPCFGMLCGRPVAAGDLETPRETAVMLEKACLFVAAPTVDGGIWVAAKSPPVALERGLPYSVCKVFPNEFAQRPDRRAASNRDARTFTAPVYDGQRPSLDSDGLRLFYGDPHVHSRISQDLDGEQDELYHLARDTSGLDFIAFTENDHTRFTEPLYAAEWEENLRNAEFFNRPGEFTVFAGWEFTMCGPAEATGAPGSHRCVLFADRRGPVYPCHDGATPDCPSLAKRFHGQSVLLHHHHPQGYDITDDSVECNIEICSAWWNCMRIPEFVEQLHGMLNRGLRLGFIGGSDNHERNPGLGGALTGVWAQANTRESIFAAFEERRVFATTGLRPDLRFLVGETFMGGRGVVHGCPEVKVQVCCDTPVLGIELIRDGECVRTESFNATEVDWGWVDRDCGPGDHWYYVHVSFATEHKELDWTLPMPLRWNIKPVCGVDAWSSPVWIHCETEGLST